MEETISSFCKTLSTFCNHVQTSAEALKQSVERRPIPFDSASSTFMQCLNRQVASSSSDLNLLESMSFGTVSFEELLGHCNEVFKKNRTDMIEIEDRLKSSGYAPETDFDEDGYVFALSTPLDLDSKLPNSEYLLDPPSSVANSIRKNIFEDDDLFDESLSLQNLGLSDVCLATLASEANGKNCNPNSYLQVPMKLYEEKQIEKTVLDKHDREILGQIEGNLGDNIKSIRASKTIIVSKEEYDGLPSYMKSVASWEDLIVAVEKINLSLEKKENTEKANFFHQDEVSALGLGSKGRSYLLLLLRMNRLVVETTGGLISYRIL